MARNRFRSENCLAKVIFRISLVVPEADKEMKQRSLTFSGGEQAEQFSAAKKAQNQTAEGGEKEEEKKQEPIVNKNKVGRNEPCPCGSGKKYKKCHGK